MVAGSDDVILLVVPATGGGDGKARLEAQSPTVQGTQSTSNQSHQQQAAPTNTQSHQQQQAFMSIPPGYHTGYYYPGAAMGAAMVTPGPYNVYPVRRYSPFVWCSLDVASTVIYR